MEHTERYNYFPTWDSVQQYTPAGSERPGIMGGETVSIKHWRAGFVSVRITDPYPHDVIYYTRDRIWIDLGDNSELWERLARIANWHLGENCHSRITLSMSSDGTPMFWSRPSRMSKAIHGELFAITGSFCLRWSGYGLEMEPAQEASDLGWLGRYFEVMWRNGCGEIIARRVRVIAQRLGKLYLIACNDRELTAREVEEVHELQRAARQELPFWVRPIFNSDPRGASIRVVLPDGSLSGWHDEGYAVPE